MSNLQNLSQADYLKAKQLFTQAIELDSTKIDAFLKKQCQDNKALYAAVVSLVAMHQDSGEATITPKQALSTLISKDKNIASGYKIGKFVIEKHIGSG
ncbi:MAG: hypothetical protein JKY19_12740, partial [Alcanivoracaceae bacterium]|nr:hypothetical protein [Alcanivoracaceae bacterium]